MNFNWWLHIRWGLLKILSAVQIKKKLEHNKILYIIMCWKKSKFGSRVSIKMKEDKKCGQCSVSFLKKILGSY